jgi:hypothetical protein
MTKRKSRWISKSKFSKLKIGQKVVIRFMMGDAIIASKPINKKGKDADGNIIMQACIDVKFNSGPWEGRTLNMLRQQLSTSTVPFPDW